jgi:predicted anti-sigma-YlaC factor YlaD
MTNVECDVAPLVIRAMKSDRWTESLQNHVKTCSRCRETIAVATMIVQISAEDPVHRLPSYPSIWIRAQFARREEQLSRLHLVAMIGLTVSGVIWVAGIVFGATSQVFSSFVDFPHGFTLFSRHLLAHGAPFLVIIGVVLLVWILTRDRFFVGR